MSFNTRIEFANYTLLFGADKVLLDLFKEIVEPSFSARRHTRKTRGSSWFFMETELVVLDDSKAEPILGLTGRLVKQTKLKRTQVLTADNQLREDECKMDNAPSSLFLLILNSHRLLFCKEMAGAPDISSFLSTSQYSLQKAHANYIEKELEKLPISSPGDRSAARKLLLLDTPYPSLRITPLLDGEELAGYISHFSIINKLTVKLLKTNTEVINNDDFWRSLGNKRDETAGESAKFEILSTSHSLNRDSVRIEAVRAGAYANSDISISGYDSQGDSLRGDNNDFTLKSEIEGLSRMVAQAARQMFGRFKKMIATGIVALPSNPTTTVSKICSLQDGIE